jgi:hypothetical protein
MAIAIATGAVAALAAGGSRGGPRPALRWVPLLLAGALTLVLVESGGVPAGAELAAVVGADLAVLAFSARNVVLVGMPVVLAGVALNVLVTVANGGMPVEGDAVVRAGVAEPSDLSAIDLGPKRHLATGDDVLVVLDDRIPLRPLREVVSVGDVVLAAGLAVVTFRLLHPAPGAPATPTGRSAAPVRVTGRTGGHDQPGT